MTCKMVFSKISNNFYFTCKILTRTYIVAGESSQERCAKNTIGGVQTKPDLGGSRDGVCGSSVVTNH